MPNNSEPDEMELPAFQSGGFVKEEGLAVVHKGEYIFPAPGSEAMIEPVNFDNQQVVNYYFPVEIVIVGSLPDEEKEAMEASIWEKLGDALDRLA
jgi:hypothetical protein